MTSATHTPNDALVERAESLFRSHADAVFNVAFRVVWSAADAEDVVQSTFVKAITRGSQLRDSSRERPWMLQIAYREALTVIRRRRDVPVDPNELPEQVSTRAGPETTMEAAEVAGQVTAALGRLAHEERAAVVLRDIEGLSMAEVAEVLGVGLSAAKMRVHRGRGSLRLLLREVATDAV